MEKEVRFRILNKTSKTVTVKLGGKPMEFPWEEFNKKLVVVDKFWAVLNEEEKKKQEEADELVNQAVICVMIQRGNSDAGNKLAHMAALPRIIDKLVVMLECDKMQVLDLIRKRLMLMNPFMVNPMFDDETLKRNHMYRKRERMEHEVERDNVGNRKVVTVSNCDNDKPTFGDAFSCLADLKEKLEK